MENGNIPLSDAVALFGLIDHLAGGSRFYDDTVVVVEAIEENVTENRFQTLSKTLLEQLSLVDFTSQSSIAMLIFLQFPLSSPIMMTEMNYVNELMDNIIPKDMDCEIKWGMSPREDTISRIVCAIKTK